MILHNWPVCLCYTWGCRIACQDIWRHGQHWFIFMACCPMTPRFLINNVLFAFIVFIQDIKNFQTRKCIWKRLINLQLHVPATNKLTLRVPRPEYLGRNRSITLLLLPWLLVLPGINSQSMYCEWHKGYHLFPTKKNLITVTSKWALWRLKSPKTRLFAQSFVQDRIKGNIKARVTGPFWGGQIPFIKGL